MTFEQVKEIYSDLRDKYEAKLTSYGVKCESEIYCENRKLEKVENADDASYFSLDINVFTNSIDKDNGLCFCVSVPVTDLRVNDDVILDEQRFFEESISEFLDKLSTAECADDAIKAEGEAAERRAEEMMRDLERKIKKTNTVALVAVGICAVAAAVALIMHFLV